MQNLDKSKVHMPSLDGPLTFWHQAQLGRLNTLRSSGGLSFLFQAPKLADIIRHWKNTPQKEKEKKTLSGHQGGAEHSSDGREKKKAESSHVSQLGSVTFISVISFNLPKIS